MLMSSCEISCLKEGWASIHVAASRGDIECLKLLLKSGANVNIQNDVSELQHCIRLGMFFYFAISFFFVYVCSSLVGSDDFITLCCKWWTCRLC